MGKAHHYHKLKEIIKTTQLILEDVADGGGIEVQKTDSKEKLGGELDYEKKKSAVMNFTKSPQNADESSDIFIQRGYKLLDTAKKAGDDAQFKVKQIVVDLTKLSNELKDLQGMSEEKLTIDRVRKVLRYVDTAVTNANKIVKELKEKRQKMESNIDWDQYQQELDNLRAKYGLDDLEAEVGEIDKEISKYEKKASDDVKKIEKENKDILRSFRAILGELYAVPKEIADVTNIYMKSYGALATMTKKKKPLNMQKEGILKILNDKELYKELGEFIENIDDYSEQVKIVGSKIPDIGTYFAELQLKVDQKIDEIEVLQDKVEKSDKMKNEAFLPKIFDKAKRVLLKAVSQFYDILAEETHDLYEKVKTSIKPFVKAMGEFDGKLKTHRQQAEKNHLRVQKIIREMEIEMIDQAEKKV